MSVRTRPPFRADHVGSLLRPPALLAARDDFANGRISKDALRLAEDAAILPLHHQVNIWAMRRGLAYAPRMDELTLVTWLRPAP